MPIRVLDAMTISKIAAGEEMCIRDSPIITDGVIETYPA